MNNKKNTDMYKTTKAFYKIGEIKKMYGFGADSLRYFEKKGILKPSRGENDYRLYSGNDLWELNIIKNLRLLDFPVKRINAYFKNRTVATTLELLEEELNVVEQKRKMLDEMSEIILSQISSIQNAYAVPFDEVLIYDLPERPIFEIPKCYHANKEFELIMKELTQINNHPLFLIGNNRVGSAISMERVKEKDYTYYDSAFIIDEDGTATIPAGKYLSIRYRGDANNGKYIPLLMAYAEQNSLVIIGPFLEMVWLEIHTTNIENEWVIELQVKVEE